MVQHPCRVVGQLLDALVQGISTPESTLQCVERVLGKLPQSDIILPGRSGTENGTFLLNWFKYTFIKEQAHNALRNET
ncbi:uncharacterized protein PGTG_21914 [Puccinia graminis f. sp. tritici CRL 75-36-700-3]|uniref:Uncharacterized protein n=1 Tax=Puccinia graminis f. sp. tritici (strain CRL 75-36-700-3 / race SCCL) TaxID=418459 RepID=H6QT09_PUCGT|nr:uncharacterized protein PGTG_21914 [Puccinia graminis f. sp. tritici CRL 75-36-700-3]EHS63960.1 hypothetical protein PGTG_21914 [Puccinia graminis f. sp. tritici CRL 75-36-700-3]